MKLAFFSVMFLILDLGWAKYSATNSNKMMSTVTAVAEDEELQERKSFSYYTKMYFRKVFSFESSLNKCKEENCKYCCLSLNFCGSKEQCENSKETMNILKILYISVCVVLGVFLLYKIYITDPEPEHKDSDKVDEATMNMLVDLFMKNNENRKKFKQ